ncbi:jg20291 [Pararge aegeria aegeria]|uniref:Jg20291 protein n=1 Tax=Pararge aegeria aegeria TaxID=348720 RepID=A0A8S4RI63_9NEOP|nr:jg20291 [Pararge aegeria aegeria]
MTAKYFVDKKALSGSIIVVDLHSHASVREGTILRAMHGGKNFSIMIKNGFRPHANASHFREKAKNYMMILKTKYDPGIHLGLLSHLPTWNPLAKVVAFYQLRPNEDGEKVAIRLTNVYRSFKILRCIILIHSPLSGEVTAYSWTPYSDDNCAGKCRSVYILDKCKNDEIIEFETEREKFPLDLKGCPLTTYAVISEPYVLHPEKMINNIEWNDVYDFQKGGEINLVKTISKFTNMTLIIRMSEKKENWGIIDPDGKATGAYEILRNDSVDLVIGNVEVTRTLRKWFDPTVSYTQDEMTWCVPKARKAAAWDNLIKIFHWSTWVSILASVIIMGSIFHFMYSKEHRNAPKWPTNSILMTLNMLLGSSSKFDPKSSKFRILVFGWLCFSLNMIITYESFLRSSLMHPRFEKQISSESDLIHSGIPLGGREIYRSYFETNNASGFYLYRKYISTTFSEGIKRAAIGRNFAVVSSRRQAEYMDQILGKGEALIYCFPERNNLYKYGVVLLTRQWFPMLERFNNIIRSVSENGLIDKWNEELFIHRISSESTTVVSLGIQHLLGAFVLTGILYAVTIVVFIGELVVGYISK